MKALKLTKKQVDLVGLSVLCKIHKDRDALEMITDETARVALQKEIERLNEILTLLTTI